MLFSGNWLGGLRDEPEPESEYASSSDAIQAHHHQTRHPQNQYPRARHVRSTAVDFLELLVDRTTTNANVSGRPSSRRLRSRSIGTGSRHLRCTRTRCRSPFRGNSLPLRLKHLAGKNYTRDHRTCHVARKIVLLCTPTVVVGGNL